jgi:hypothetical protein
MAASKNGSTKEMLERIMAQAKSGRANPQEDYRERALKLFPWVCARCGREFEGKNLKELTVHHKDHNHDHNPPDGSNWELLCVYCHDNEHSREEVADAYSGSEPDREEGTFSTHSPFAGLADLLKDKE